MAGSQRTHGCLVAVGGLIASGKSSVARRLAAQLGAELLCADEIRADLAERGAPDALLPGFSRRLYPELLARARAVLADGGSVVLDGTFRSRALRAAARNLARECGVPFRFVECRAGHAACRERLRRRERAQGRPGWLALFEHFLELWEAVDELPAEEHLMVDTSGPPGSLVDLELGLPGRALR